MIDVKPVDTISPTLIKQFSYCPVILWIKTWLLASEPVTDSMVIGAECIKPPSGVGQVLVRTSIGSTVIDELEGNSDGSSTIIERKKFRSYNYSRYIEQAVTSYIIARNRIPRIRRVKLEMSTSKTIDLLGELIEDIEKIFEKAREIIKREKPPPRPANIAKCNSCWYKRYCPYW